MSVWRVTGANAINSHQWIAGSAQGTDGMIHAVLVVPNKADTDRDGSIEPLDLAGYLDNYTSGHITADLNGDAVINTVDINYYIENYNAGTSSGTTGSIGTGGNSSPTRPTPVNCLRSVSSSCGDYRCQQWNQNNPGQYSADCNPSCYGCGGCDQNNPDRPDGAPGWPGDDPRNPDAPNGGPGGKGCPGGVIDDAPRPGRGGGRWRWCRAKWKRG
jgi:hypothetical protein